MSGELKVVLLLTYEYVIDLTKVKSFVRIHIESWSRSIYKEKRRLDEIRDEIRDVIKDEIR